MRTYKGKKAAENVSFRTIDSSSTIGVLLDVVNQRVDNHRRDPDGALMADESQQDHEQGNQPSNSPATTATTTATTSKLEDIEEGLPDDDAQQKETSEEEKQRSRRSYKDPKAKHTLTVSSHGEVKKDDAKEKKETKEKKGAKRGSTARRSTSSTDEVLMNVINQRIESHRKRSDPDGQRIEGGRQNSFNSIESSSDHNSTFETNVVLEDIEEGCAEKGIKGRGKNTTSTTADTDANTLSDPKNTDIIKGDSKGPPTATTHSGSANRPSVAPGAYRSNPGSSEDQPILRSLASIRRLFTRYTTSNSNINVPTNDDATSPTTGTMSHPPPVEHTVSAEEVIAVHVDQEELENNIRRQIIQESVLATSVTLYGGDEAQMLDQAHASGGDNYYNNNSKDDDGMNKLQKKQRRRRLGLYACLFCCLLLVMIIVLAVTLSSRDKSEQEASNLQTSTTDGDDDDDDDDDDSADLPLLLGEDSTMRTIADRGFLRCALTGIIGEMENSIDWIMCKAIASAVLGGPENIEVEAEVYSDVEAYQLLDDGEVDVVMASKDTLAIRSISKYRRSIPYMYDGMGFSGRRQYEQCVTSRVRNNTDVCSGMVICVQDYQDKIPQLIDLLGPSGVLVCEDLEELYSEFIDGNCDIIAALGHERVEENLRRREYIGTWFSSNHLFDTSFIHSIVSPSKDIQWSNFVDTVLHGLVKAGMEGILRVNAEDRVGHSDRFGEDYENMYVHALQFEGNYGQIWNTVAQLTDIPQTEQDGYNFGDTGLLYYYELGDTDFEGTPLHPQGITSRILTRGRLKCGVRLSRQGFADKVFGGGYSGIDVAYCRALSASLFGEQNPVEFIELDDFYDGFLQVEDQEIDVYAGAPWIYTDDMWNSSRPFYYLSDPYYYGGVEDIDELEDYVPGDQEPDLCLLTSGEDPQWAAYVSTIVKALVYAYHDELTFDEMPDVLWYGASQSKMLANAVQAGGHYGNIMDRELEPFLTRNEFNNRNYRNKRGSPKPQLYASIGILNLL